MINEIKLINPSTTLIPFLMVWIRLWSPLAHVQVFDPFFAPATPMLFAFPALSPNHVLNSVAWDCEALIRRTIPNREKSIFFVTFIIMRD